MGHMAAVSAMPFQWVEDILAVYVAYGHPLRTLREGVPEWLKFDGDATMKLILVTRR